MSILDKLNGVGMDQLEQSAAMPLLKLLGFQSPEITDPDKKIEGAQAGDILFAPTGEILKQPIEFVVLSKCSYYAEWKPKSAGGGLVGHHPKTIIGDPEYVKGSDRSEWDEFLGKNELKWTMYYAIRFVKDGEWTEGILAFTKTGNTKAGRPLNDMIKKFQYPEGVDQIPFLFSRTYLLSSFLDKNADNSWYNWKVEAGDIISLEDEQEFLSECYDMVKPAAQALPSPHNNQPQQKALANAVDAEAVEVF